MASLRAPSRSGKSLLDMGEPTPPRFPLSVELRTDVRSYLADAGYRAGDVAAALRWIADRNALTACPVIAPEHWQSVNRIVEASRLAEAQEAAGGDVEGHPDSWPSYTDYFRFHPTEADSVWVASEGTVDLLSDEPSELDRRAAVSVAMDAYEAGLVAPDERPVKVRPERRPGACGRIDPETAERIMGGSLVGHRSR